MATYSDLKLLLGRLGKVRSKLARSPRRHGRKSSFQPGIENLEERQVPAGSISGQVVVDATGNGYLASAPAQSGVTVNLYKDVNANGALDSGDTLAASKVTGTNGTYSFTNLANGRYVVSETTPNGYVNTNRSAEPTYAVNLVNGQAVTGENFANFQTLNTSLVSNISFKITTSSGVSTTVTDLRGNVHQGDTVTANFTVAQGATGVVVSLAAYDAPGPTFDPNTASQQTPVQVASGTFSAGPHSLTIKVPSNYFQVDFVRGFAIQQLGPAGSNIFYGAEGRLYSADNGGTQTPPTPSSLSGFVYADVNNDGVKQSTEAGIAGVKVTLTGSNDLGAITSVIATTDANGFYQFANLRPGTYAIAETQPSAYLDGKDTIGTPGGTTTNDKFSNINLAGGVNGANNNFGELPPASLSGFVYADVNNDGVKQSTEAGIAGAKVTLTGTNDLGTITTVTATTDSTGLYKFSNLRPGTYVISETQPSAYLDGKDTVGTPGGTTTNDKFSNVVLKAGVNGANNNFGELPPASLSGYVYADVNNDGTKQSTEAGISGVTVTLTGTNDLGTITPVSVQTDANGFYQFANLRPGTYVISETQPSAYLDGKDTIGTPGGTTTNDKFSNVVLKAGVSGADNNFGELPPTGLSGYVYADLNNDGVKQSTEAGIAGATVTLTGTNDLGAITPISVQTNSSGFYQFVNLRPGTYVISETQPANYLDGKDTIGTPGGTAGNDVFTNVVLGAGISGANNNFGELPPASLSGFVYSDLNNDGTKQSGEKGIGGATVTLTGTNDLGTITPVTATTDANGFYQFLYLRPGTYAITEAQPDGYLDGKDTIGTPGGTVGNDKFSNVVLNAAVNGANNNFGELPPASPSGFVYADLNNDGVKQATEAGIAGVSVTLSGTDDRGNSVSQTVTTDATGRYEFAGLRPGTYAISETQPANFLDGKDTIGTQGGTAGDDVFTNVVLTAGVNGANNNFGELPPASLSGYVYADLNNDGVKQAGESGIGGVTVKLSGTDDRGNSVSQTATTDETGLYKFSGLRPGTYALSETQPAAYLDGKDTVGTPGGTVGNDVFTNVVLGVGVNGADNNFGELPPASLSGYVYADVNNDGLKLSGPNGEKGIGGATVALSGTDDRGNSVSLTATTDGSGFYQFLYLRPGTYAITETQPDGYLDGKDTIGTPGGTTTNDKFSNVVLKASVNGADNNFGELPPSSLSGFVYADVNNNGAKDDVTDDADAEKGIKTVTVALSGTDDLGNSVSLTATTDGSGHYEFTNLRPGTYAISEAQPDDYLDGKDTVGTPGGATGDDQFTNIKLAAGVDGSNNNFGELPPASLSGYVYLDGNDNGVKEEATDDAVGETGIGGVTVTLTGTDDLGNSVSLTTTTDETGFYKFAGLRPGTYAISEMQPDGYDDGQDTIGTQGGTPGNDQFTGIDLTAGINGKDNNFGEKEQDVIILPTLQDTPTGSLSGFVYMDDNGNGVKDEGDRGVVDQDLYLYDTNGALVAHIVTDENGFYQFSGLEAGTYQIQESQPYGANQGTNNVGSLGGTVVDDTFTVTLPSGVTGLNYNFGELPPDILS